MTDLCEIFFQIFSEPVPMLSTDDRMKVKKKRESLINSCSLLGFHNSRSFSRRCCLVKWSGRAAGDGRWLESWHALAERLNLEWWPGSRSSRSAARTSPSLKNKDLFLALDMPAAQNNKALNERSSTTLQSQASAYFCPQTSSVSLVLFIPPTRQRMSSAQQEPATCNMLHACSDVRWSYTG